MTNPIFSTFNSQTNNNNNNSLFQMLNNVRNAPNPDAAMQTMLLNNPQLQGVLNYINQNGGDAKTAFYNMAAQKGIDPNVILNQLR